MFLTGVTYSISNIAKQLFHQIGPHLNMKRKYGVKESVSYFFIEDCDPRCMQLVQSDQHCNLSLLVPIKLTPRPIMQWPILKSFTMLRRQNKDAFRSVKEKCWTLSNGQPGAPSLGGREVTAVTIIYEQLRYNQPLTCNFITNDPTVGWQTITSSADQHRWNSTKGLRTKQTITNQEEHFICDSWNKQ